MKTLLIKCDVDVGWGGWLLALAAVIVDALFIELRILHKKRKKLALRSLSLSGFSTVLVGLTDNFDINSCVDQPKHKFERNTSVSIPMSDRSAYKN
jgi:hypothetical protein